MSCPHGNWGACDACDDIDNAYASGAKQIASLTEQNERLRGALELIQSLPFELNVSNYTHDDVCELNTRAVEAILAARAALKSVSP